MVRIHPDPPGCEMARIASQSRREAPTNKEWRSRESGAARGLDVYKGVHERPSNKAWRSERGCSSVGRAPALQAGGHRFDPVQLHQPVLEVRQPGSVRNHKQASERLLLA